MKKAQMIELILMGLLIMLIGYAFYTANVIQQFQRTETILGAGVPDYHFAIITDDTRSYSWNTYYEGLLSEAQKKKAVAEVFIVKDPTMPGQIDKAFELAELSKVDGVMVKLSNNQLARNQIAKVREEGVWVVAIGNDSPDSTRDVYIGTNKYNLGRTAAGIVHDSNSIPVEVLVILSDEYTDQGGAFSNGFLNGIHDYNAQTPCISKLLIEYSSKKRAELILSDTLENYTIKTVICTDPIDSIRVSKVLIDLNKVGDVQVVASGEVPEILDYLRTKTIHATVVEDYKTQGILSIDALYNLLQNNRQSGYINVPIKLVDQENVQR